MSKDSRIQPARPVLISSDCKQETGEEHAKVIQTVIDGINALKDKTGVRVVSLATDGESRRGSALALLTFEKELPPDSPIYEHLHKLKFLDLHVGADDITPDKDYKHIFKRFRNSLLRQRGTVVNGIRITPDIIRDHLRENGASADHIRSIMNPEDKQDVKLAYDLLQAVWSLPRTCQSQNPSFIAAREALWTLGKLFYHTVFPFLCIDLSLSEQIEHLSTAAHLAMTLYKQDGTNFMANNLYTDLQIFIKNAIFCAAKAKVDDPNGKFYIILLGTDRLEELFGILRTMVGNDSNLDTLQLSRRLASTTEISNIFARYPQWDKGPRRLKMPVISRDSTELHDCSDHIKPGLWRGNVSLKDLSLLTSWNRGRQLVEKDCPFATTLLRELENTRNITTLAPLGELLVNIPLTVDDQEDERNAMEPPPVSSPTADLHTRVEVEDALAELDEPGGEVPASSKKRTDPRQVLIGNTYVRKSRALAQYSKYRVVANSTDRLRRVQAEKRYTGGIDQLDDIMENMPSSATLTGLTNDNMDILQLADPIASVLQCDSRLWLCIGEVNGLRVDGKAAASIELDVLHEKASQVSFQILGLRPATDSDDPDLKHDWRTYRMKERSFTVPGALISPLNPSLSTTHAEMPWYLLSSTVLVAVAAMLTEGRTPEQLRHVPKIARSKAFPYCEKAGEFVWI